MIDTKVFSKTKTVVMPEPFKQMMVKYCYKFNDRFIKNPASDPEEFKGIAARDDEPKVTLNSC